MQLLTSRESTGLISNIYCTGSLQVWQIIIEKIRLEEASGGLYFTPLLRDKCPFPTMSALSCVPWGHRYQPETHCCCSQQVKLAAQDSPAEEQNRLGWDQQSLDSSALKCKPWIFLTARLESDSKGEPRARAQLRRGDFSAVRGCSNAWRDEGAQAAFDLEQSATAPLQRALQVVLVINPPKGRYRDNW